jgi:phage terminase large subunit
MKEWINAQPRQREFLRVFAPKDWTQAKKFPFYGGAAGGGKSYIGRKGLAKLAIQAYVQFGVKNCAWGLFCEDYPSLKDRHLSKISQEFPRWMGELKDHRDLGLVFRFSERFGNNYIALRNLDDPNRYDSSEFADMYVDELTKNTVEVFDELRKRLRWPRKVEDGGVFPDGYQHKFGAGANPGGIGHGFVKQYWIDHDLPEWLKPYANQFVFIPAKASDNIYNPEDYLQTLLSLPPDLAKAYAEGSWDQFKGQYFKQWRQAYHIVPAFEIPKFWNRIIAVDWGWTNPFCCLFAAVSPDGEVYIYHELYGTERLPEWWAERIAEQIERDGKQVADYLKVIDPSAFNKEPRFGRPVQEMMAEAGLTFERANNDRLNGWMQVQTYLAWEKYPHDDSLELGNLKRKPKMYVMKDQGVALSRAPNLVRTLPVQVSDENRPEDVDTDGEDHAPDTLRYLLQTRPALTKIPFSALSDEWKEALLRAKQREKERRQ